MTQETLNLPLGVVDTKKPPARSLRWLEVQFDGGCRPTNPGNKYGSYRVMECIAGKRLALVSVSRQEFGFGTNNEAEFDALIRCLDALGELMERTGQDRRDFALRIITDSTIVRNRLLGRYSKQNSEPARRMAALCNECVKRMMHYGDTTVHWSSREANVEVFGH